MRQSRLRIPTTKNDFSAQDSVDDFGDLLLNEILHLCGESCATRRDSVVGSSQWHKCTGEILAYARLTHFVERLRSVSTDRRLENSAHRVHFIDLR